MKFLFQCPCCSCFCFMKTKTIYCSTYSSEGWSKKTHNHLFFEYSFFVRITRYYGSTSN
ncbi:hypothetical protein DsansV1_C29g0207421 [Dioscorea sansibarensis]